MSEEQKNGNGVAAREDILREKTAVFEAAVARSAPLRVVSKAYTEMVLARLGGNKVHTARQLEIDRRSIQRWGCDASA